MAARYRLHVDPNSFVTLVLLTGIVLAVVVRGRAKRADRKRDAREAAERRGTQPTDRSLY